MAKRMQEEKEENRIFSQSRRWTSSRLLRQVLRLCKVQYSGHPVILIGRVHGTWRKRSQSRRTVEFFGMCRKTCRTRVSRIFRELGNRRQWRRLATQSPYFNKLRAAHGDGLLDRETKIWSQSDGWLEGPRCEHRYMGKFMSVTFQAAVHLGQDFQQNLRSVKNQSSKSVGQSFRTTEKLIKDHKEIAGLSTIDWNQPL